MASAGTERTSSRSTSSNLSFTCTPLPRAAFLSSSSDTASESDSLRLTPSSGNRCSIFAFPMTRVALASSGA